MKFKLVICEEEEEQVVAMVHKPSALTQKIEQLVLQYAGNDKLAVSNEDELLMLPYANIECITVLDGKTYAIDTAGKHYRVKQRLYELEKNVPSTFLRINKSTLANETHLDCFTSTYSGAVNARFKCGYEDYVSRRCFAAIKRRFQVK